MEEVDTGQTTGAPLARDTAVFGGRATVVTRVFLAATSLRAEYGGPAYSVVRLASALAAVGADVSLWSADGSTTPALSAESPPGLRVRTGDLMHAITAFGRPDVIHDNGLWRPHNHALARVARRLDVPRIVSTRGMLEPWALNHKKWRKRVAWLSYQANDLRCASRLHATSDGEAEHLESRSLDTPVIMIPNGMDLPELDDEDIDAEAPSRTALFLGRIHPVKGLPTLIQAWDRARPAGWKLRIVGPDEHGHRAEIARIIASKNLNDTIEVLDAVAGDGKRNVLRSADLVVLPSLSESFGVAVAEALAYGIPVLASTAVPWPDLERKGCGWLADPTAAGLAAGLARATAESDATLRTMGAAGRAWMAAEFNWATVAERFMHLYAAVHS